MPTVDLLRDKQLEMEAKVEELEKTLKFHVHRFAYIDHLRGLMEQMEYKAMAYNEKLGDVNESTVFNVVRFFEHVFTHMTKTNTGVCKNVPLSSTTQQDNPLSSTTQQERPLPLVQKERSLLEREEHAGQREQKQRHAPQQDRDKEIEDAMAAPSNVATAQSLKGLQEGLASVPGSQLQMPTSAVHLPAVHLPPGSGTAATPGLGPMPLYHGSFSDEHVIASASPSITNPSTAGRPYGSTMITGNSSSGNSYADRQYRAMVAARENHNILNLDLQKQDLQKSTNEPFAEPTESSKGRSPTNWSPRTQEYDRQRYCQQSDAKNSDLKKNLSTTEMNAFGDFESKSPHHASGYPHTGYPSTAYPPVGGGTGGSPGPRYHQNVEAAKIRSILFDDSTGEQMSNNSGTNNEMTTGISNMNPSSSTTTHGTLNRPVNVPQTAPKFQPSAQFQRQFQNNQHILQSNAATSSKFSEKFSYDAGSGPDVIINRHYDTQSSSGAPEYRRPGGTQESVVSGRSGPSFNYGSTVAYVPHNVGTPGSGYARTPGGGYAGTPGGYMTSPHLPSGVSTNSSNREKLTFLPAPPEQSQAIVLTVVGNLQVQLGNGSWANAYRNADPESGYRKALELLYRTGIVSAKELEDDLTVIATDHINECVEIANEMLKSQPASEWSKKTEFAQSYFETELTKLYTRKFGGKIP